MSAFQNLLDTLGGGSQNIQQQKVAGAQMRQILTEAKVPIPQTPIPYDEMEKLYNGYISSKADQQKEIFNLQQKELSAEQQSQQTAQQQGEGMLSSVGRNFPGIVPGLQQGGTKPDVIGQFLEQLQNSGGLTPQAQAQVKPGIAALGGQMASGEIKTPLDKAQIGEAILPNAPPKAKNALEDINRKVSETGVASLTAGEKELWDHQQNIATARAQAYSAARPYAVIDTTENNTPKFVTGDELKKAQTAEPGRYAPPGPELTALNQNQFIADLRGSVALTKESLTNLKTEFTPEFRAKVAYALRSNDPHSAIDTLISSQFAKNLTPDQMQYVTDITQLHEQLLTMRSVLGAGQGSDELRAAIRATAPGPGTPTKEYGLVQLDKINKTIDRLAPYILKANPRKDMGGAATPQAPAEQETKVIGGITYKSLGNGRWEKQ